MQVVILFYGGHLVITGQMSGGTLISFIIYELELGECLEVGNAYCNISFTQFRGFVDARSLWGQVCGCVKVNGGKVLCAHTVIS